MWTFKRCLLHHLLLAVLVQVAAFPMRAEAWSPSLPRSLTRKISNGVLVKGFGKSTRSLESRSSRPREDSNMVLMQMQLHEKRRQRRKMLYRVSALCILAITAVWLPLRPALASEITLAQSSPAAAVVGESASVVVAQSASAATQRISLLREIRLSMRLVFASLVGSLLGWERSSTKHSAGIRTMALVSLGAATFTICSGHMFLAPGLKYDPSRMAANVASGVGFIGAGVITTPSSRHNPPNVVHGLTTAAAIWISAAVGVAAGAGLYVVSGMASVATIAILRLGKKKKKPPEKKADGRRATTAGSSSTFQAPNAHREVFIVADDEPVDTSIWDEHHVRSRPEETAPSNVRIVQSSNTRNDDTIPQNLSKAIQDAVKRAADQEVLGRTIANGLKPEMAGVPLWNATAGDEMSPSAFGP